MHVDLSGSGLVTIVSLRLSEPVVTDGDLHSLPGYLFILFLYPIHHLLYPPPLPNMSISGDGFLFIIGLADKFQLIRISLAPPTPQGPPTPVTILGFDPDQELLWAGNEYVSPMKEGQRI